jgi:carbon monoxide dehydrogenase subunit G
MNISVSEEISAPRERIWHIITDFDSWADTIEGILSVEVIDRPESGLVGLKWREQRVMFGKEAYETMWISSAEPNSWYETTAENHGMIYNSRLSLTDKDDKTVLTMQFSGRPTTFGAKLMSMMGFMFNGMMRKMLQKDLADIRDAAERVG